MRKDAAESCRLVQDNSRKSHEVHSASSVLNGAGDAQVGATGATVISLRLFRPSKDPAVRQDQKQSGTA